MPTLKPYQEAGREFLLAALRRRPSVAVLADDPGLGKTATGSVVIADLLARTGRGGLVVCPAALRRTWKAEMAKWGTTATVLLPATSADVRPPSEGEVLILSFDTLAQLPPEVWRALRSSPPGWLIADELQKIRTARSSRSCRFEDLVKIVRGPILALTGTLVENKPLDLWIVCVRLGIERVIFPGGISEFAEHFGGAYDFAAKRWAFPVTPPGGSIYSRLIDSGHFLVRKIEEVEGDLPPKTYKATICPTPSGIVDLSRDLAHALGIDDAGEGLEVADLEARATAQGLLGDLSRLRKESAIAKIPTMLARLDALVDEEPIVVYSEHVDPIKTLEGRPGWAVITGAETQRRRQQITDDFQAGRYRGIGITSAVREGLTYTRASYFLRVSFSWLDAWERQSEGRVWRLSQERPVTIEVLIAEHAIERAVLRRLGEGRQRNALIWARPEAP